MLPSRYLLRKIVRLALPFAAILGAMITPAASAAATLNIYSARQEALIKPLLDRFSNETGIVVNLVTGSGDALISRLTSEGRNSPADILLTTDAGRLFRARKAGVLQPVTSDTLNSAVRSEEH
ncbi:MAG: substrate-binding domain-containing protein, partial [Chromatocurvus sp.]